MAEKDFSAGRLVGYARVSTTEQETALQLAALTRAGVVTVYEDRRSAVKHRPSLERMLAELRPGDVVVVYKVDRLARSLIHLLGILARLEAAGAGFRSLTEPIETVTPAGRMMLHILGAVGEFERAIIRERSMAGQAVAMAKGVQFGRPFKVDYARCRALRAEGLSLRQIAAQVGSPYSSVASALRPRFKRRSEVAS